MLRDNEFTQRHHKDISKKIDLQALLSLHWLSVYLYFRTELNTLKSGTCVAGKDTCKFLEERLAQLGLNDKEQDDFITYWLPRMQDNPYNVISFQTDEYAEHFGLEVSPESDTDIRVFMTYKASEVYVDIAPEEIATPVRIGFFIVEWGGCEMPK